MTMQIQVKNFILLHIFLPEISGLEGWFDLVITLSYTS